MRTIGALVLTSRLGDRGLAVVVPVVVGSVATNTPDRARGYSPRGLSGIDESWRCGTGR